MDQLRLYDRANGSRMRDLQQQLLADTGKDISPAGMLSRVGCASDLCFNGIPSCIVNGREKDVLLRLCKGEKIGTRFDPQSPSKSSKKTT